MSAAADWKPAPLLPLETRREFPLGFVIAVLCFLACLSGLAAAAADRAAQGWARDLRGEATVQVRPRGDETPSAAAARAAEALAGVPGVTEAAALERQKAEALLKPWIGDAASLPDLPIPQLVTVRLDPEAPASAAALAAALRAAGVDGTVDDHGRWSADVERAASTVRWTALFLSALMALTAAAMIAFATRAAMAARKEVVEVLHLSGATDGFVAGVFQRRYAQVAAYAGLGGAAGAAVLAGSLRLFGGGEGLTPALPFAWSDLTLLLPCPLVAATVAALTVRLTALRLLEEEERE